ncbi:MAG: D-alanyl-D-alanine carboxypeptidase family protein [Pseudomonadota bacterium]
MVSLATRNLVRLFALVAAAAGPGFAYAAAPIIPPPPDVAASSHLLIDHATGRVLTETNADEPLPPASLTKIMTVYIAATEIAAGRLSLEEEVTVSTNAWRTPGSRMFLDERSKVPVLDVLKGVIIQSGNDASVALAEHIAGSEDAFADMMNQQAQALGMVSSQFQNATGLPAADHYTTARDLILLTQSMIREYPELYALYSERKFKHNDIEQPNRNRLLWRDRTVDGVKTGHTDAAGYCLVSSAKRENMRLVSVVMGTDSDEARMRESQKLLSYGFRYFETRDLYSGDEVLKTARVWYGTADQVELGLADPVVLTIPRGAFGDIEAELEVRKTLEAPIAAGEAVGEVTLRLHDDVIYTAPLVARETVAEGGLVGQGMDFIQLFFSRLLSLEE